MKTLLKQADLTADQFIELIGTCPPANQTTSSWRIWTEAPDGWALDWWSTLEGQLQWCGAHRNPMIESTSDCIKRSSSGRLFSPDGQLQWRVVPSLGGTCWRTVFIGSNTWNPALLEDQTAVLANLTPQTKYFFLWGQQTTHTPEEWIELRIPHRFRYPLPESCQHAKRIQAKAELWNDATGQTHFMRLCDLIPYQEAN